MNELIKHQNAICPNKKINRLFQTIIYNYVCNKFQKMNNVFQFFTFSLNGLFVYLSKVYFSD